MGKWSLRREVQEFCGQFPVYRLEPFTPDIVTVVSEDDDTPVGTTVIFCVVLLCFSLRETLVI